MLTPFFPLLFVRSVATRLQHTSAYVSIRQHTSAYVSIHGLSIRGGSIRQHTSAYAAKGLLKLPSADTYVSIRQHTPAYVSIRQHTWRMLQPSSFQVSQHTSAYVSIRQHTSAYVSIRQHTSTYVSIRQHTSAYVAYASAKLPSGPISHACCASHAGETLTYANVCWRMLLTYADIC